MLVLLCIPLIITGGARLGAPTALNDEVLDCALDEKVTVLLKPTFRAEPFGFTVFITGSGVVRLKESSLRSSESEKLSLPLDCSSYGSSFGLKIPISPTYPLTISVRRENRSPYTLVMSSSF